MHIHCQLIKFVNCSNLQNKCSLSMMIILSSNHYTIILPGCCKNIYFLAFNFSVTGIQFYFGKYLGKCQVL